MPTLGSNPSHWADQCLILLTPFIMYLKAVKETNDMNPPGFEGKSYVHASIFYGDNGGLAWINDRLADYSADANKIVRVMRDGR